MTNKNYLNELKVKEIKDKLAEWETNEFVTIWSFIDLLETNAQRLGVALQRYELAKLGYDINSKPIERLDELKTARENSQDNYYPTYKCVALIRAGLAEFMAKEHRAMTNDPSPIHSN